MSKQKYIVQYPIGTGEKNNHKPGAEINLDPDDQNTQRWLKAKAITTPEELAKKFPHAKADDQDGAKVAELERSIEEKDEEIKKASDAVQAEAKRADDAEAKVAELEKSLEAAKAEGSKSTGKAAK